MIRVRKQLLWFLLRQTRPVTFVAVPMAVLYVLVTPAVLNEPTAGPVFFILVHASLVTCLFGRSRAGDFAFLYTRGYSRDCLWAHTMLASVTAVLALWLPAATLIWTGARCLVQDRLLQNPEFPIMANSEMLLPLKWLLGYVVLLPTYHYASIRGVQPTREPFSGVVASCVVVAGLLMIGPWTWPANWLGWLTYAAYGAAAATMGAASLRLHRRVEVEA